MHVASLGIITFPTVHVIDLLVAFYLKTLLPAGLELDRL